MAKRALESRLAPELWIRIMIRSNWHWHGVSLWLVLKFVIFISELFVLLFQCSVFVSQLLYKSGHVFAAVMLGDFSAVECVLAFFALHRDRQTIILPMLQQGIA